MRTLFQCVIITAFAVCCATTVCKAQDKKWTEENERDLAAVSDVYAKYALDAKPSIVADTNLIGIWKMEEDLDPHNYFVIERDDRNALVFTYMNHEGANRTFENFDAFFSKIGNTEFINAHYQDWRTEARGHFFLKVIERDQRGFHMTLALVADTTLKDLPNAAAVRARVTKNLDNPDYYKKPVHFRKILPLMYCK